MLFIYLATEDNRITSKEQQINPLTPRRTLHGVPFHWNFSSILKEGIIKKGRRKEPIIGYVPENDEKKNLVCKGLKKMKISKFH